MMMPTTSGPRETPAGMQAGTRGSSRSASITAMSQSLLESVSRSSLKRGGIHEFFATFAVDHIADNEATYHEKATYQECE